MNYYYADSENKRAGPVSWDYLEHLIRDGALNADPMVVPEGGGEWRPLSFWGAHKLAGSPALPDRSSGASDVTSTTASDTRAAFKVLANNPVGGLSTAFENLGPQRSMGAGIALGAVFVLSWVLAGYRLKSAFLGHISLGSSLYFKGFVLTVVPFASLVASNFAARMLFRAQGNWGHDCFVAGASILPLAFPVIVACVVGIGENPIVFTVLVAIASCSLASLILFAGLTQIYRIPIRPASFVVPVEFAVVALAVHLVSKILFSGGPI